MTDLSGTIQELFEENSFLKQRIKELEQAESGRKRAEESLRLITDSMSDMVRVTDLQGVNLYASPSHAKVLGYKPEERVGKSSFEIVHPDDVEHIIKVFTEGLINKKPGKAEYRIKHAEGHYVWLETIADGIFNDQGEVTAVILNSRDITERKRAEDALRLKEVELRAIVESTGNGILAVDHTGRVILTNRRFAELWNIPPVLLDMNNDEALLKYALIELVDPDAFLEKVRALYQSTVTDHDMVLFKDGRMMERYSYPILSEGVIRGRVWSFRDITDQNRAETALKNSELLFKNAFSMSPAMMGIHRLTDRMYIEINPVFTEYSGYEWKDIVGHTMDELGFLEPATLQQLRKIFSERNRISNQEIRYRTKAGEQRYALYSAILIEDTEKKVLSYIYDITERKHSEELLKLREEESLMLAKNLEEANIALRVVLSRRDEDQKILEEKIQSNVNEIVLPFIRSLNRINMENRDRHYLDLLESNLMSILSPFVKNMSGKYPNLTPKEMQIAEMIRQGENSKDIADMLGTSVATVNTHRNNIRKKLNVRKQKTNLRSHLLSLS
jgi:PAS domain S-box-containing protein